MSFEILTDTSANLPTSMVRELGLHLVPFVYIENGVEKTCMDIDAFDDRAYYGALRAGTKVSTSMVSENAYYEAMEPMAQRGDVLSISMSSGVSGAYHCSQIAAQRVRENHPDVRVETFDTRGASLGEGLLVLEAARMRNEGATLDEVLAMLNEKWQKMQQIFTVDDLMHLLRGGRVSRVAAIVGSVLHIKPILEADKGGHIIIANKVRGRKKAIRHMADDLLGNISDPKNDTIGIAHADCPEDVQLLEDFIRQGCPEAKFLTVKYEPVTGSHVGPGALALFYFGKTARTHGE